MKTTKKWYNNISDIVVSIYVSLSHSAKGGKKGRRRIEKRWGNEPCMVSGALRTFSPLSSAAAVVDVAIYSLSFDGRYPYIILIGK
jgi:hypothetical protein